MDITFNFKEINEVVKRNVSPDQSIGDVISSIMFKELEDYKLSILLFTQSSKVLNKADRFSSLTSNDDIIVHCQNKGTNKPKPKVKIQEEDPKLHSCLKKPVEHNKEETLTFRDNSTYTGEITNGKPNGHGIFNYFDGSTYEGQFSNGLRNGKGIYKYTSGASYEGEYLNDKKEGYGIFKYLEGEVYEGYWKNGRRHGNGTLKYPSGKVQSGIWENGILNA